MSPQSVVHRTDKCHAGTSRVQSIRGDTNLSSAHTGMLRVLNELGQTTCVMASQNTCSNKALAQRQIQAFHALTRLSTLYKGEFACYRWSVLVAFECISHFTKSTCTRDSIYQKPKSGTIERSLIHISTFTWSSDGEVTHWGQLYLILDAAEVSLFTLQLDIIDTWQPRKR